MRGIVKGTMKTYPQLMENVGNLTEIAEVTFLLITDKVVERQSLDLLFTGFSYLSPERSSNSWVGDIVEGSALLAYTKLSIASECQC